MYFEIKLSRYAEEFNKNPGSTEKMFHMVELMRAAGRAAEGYLTAPKEATTLAQEAQNLHVSADRTYKKTADNQGHEKVQPAPEKKGKKK